MSKARSSTRASMASGSKSQDRRGSRMVDSSDDLKKLTASSAATVVNIGEYEEKTKADLKEMLDGFDVHYASKATKPELLDLLEKALLSKYTGKIGEQNSPATESKSVGRSAKSGSKTSKPTVTFRDSQITAREGDVPPVYQLRSRDRSLSSRKLRRTTAESHIASNNSICIMKGEKVREIDNFLFYPARPASRDRSPSASSTRTRKSRTRSMRSSPSGSESTMDDQSNRSTQQSPELEGVSVADEMHEYNPIAYQADNVIMEGPYRAADNEDDRLNDNDDDRHDGNEGDEEGHHGDDGDDVDEDEDEFYDAADGSFLMDVVSPEYTIADPPQPEAPVATTPVESHHSQAFLNEGQEQHVIAAPAAADTCLRGVDDGAGSVFDDDGEDHEDDEYEGPVDGHQSDEEEDNLMLGGNQHAHVAADQGFPGFDGDMDEEGADQVDEKGVDQVDEEGAEPVAREYASDEVDDGGDSSENDARLEGNEEFEGEGDEVMDEEELESISDDDDEDESEPDDPDHYDDEEDFDDDDGDDDDDDEEEEVRNEFDQHGDDEDISFAVNNASEVIDLLSSDDDEPRDDVPCDRPAPSSTVPEISAAVAASALVRDRPSVESAHTEIEIEGSCDAETKEGPAAGPALDDYSGTLSSGPTNSAVAKLETVLHKLTRTFVSAVSSSLTAMGSTAATGEATKLSPEDYNFLKSILEKTKPDCEYAAPDLGREVLVPSISTTAIEAVQTKPVYFVDTTLSALDETDASKSNEGDNSYSSSIPQLSSSQKSTAPGQDTTGGSKVKLISFGEHDAVIPRSSYDGKSWTSRESFLPNTPSTPADPTATQELFTDQSSFHYQKDLFNAAAPILRRMPTPYYAPGSNKRSAFDAGFSESMIANAGNTPFSRTAPQSSSSGSAPPFQPMKRMSFDGYNASSYSGALQLTSSLSNGNSSSSASLSRFQSRGIGTGEVAPTGLIPFQGRPSYTPAFRRSSAQVSSAPKSFPNVVLNNASSESALSANTAFNGASNTVASSRSLSYIQRRRLQRDSITSQSAAMAQKILQTLSGIKSPIEQHRRKPVAITWRDEPDALSTAQSSSSGPQSIAGSAQADHTKDGAAASHSSGSLGFKGQSTQQQQPVGANLQSPFLHSSLRQKNPTGSSSSTTITDSKNHPQQQKVSFSLPDSTVGRGDSLSRTTAAADSRTATPTSSSSSSFTAEDQEFTFGDPMVVSGVEDVGDPADVMTSPTGEDGRAIKYMFSATKSKNKNHKASTVAPTQHVGLAAFKPTTATSAIVNNELATASPAINIWAASSINDGIKCKVCMVKNKKEATKCASCESPLESISISSTAVNNIWAASSINDGIKCKVCMVKNKKEAKKCASCESVLDVGSSAVAISAAEPQKQQLLGFSFGASPAADMSKKPTDFINKASTTGFTFPSSSSTTNIHRQIISSEDQSRESSISKGGFVFNPSSLGTSAPAAASVQFGTFSRSASVAAPEEESRKKVSFSSASNDSSRGSNDDESSDQPSKRKLHRGVSETTSAFSPTAFNGGFSTQAEPLHIGGSVATNNSAGTTAQTSQTPLFSFGSSVPTADAPKPFAFGVRSGGSNASVKDVANNGAALFKFDGVPANPLSSANTSSSFNSFGATDRSSTSGFGISTTPSQSSVVNLSVTSGDPPPPAASSNSSSSKPFVFGASDSQSSGNKPFTFNASSSSASSSSFSNATSDKTGLFSVTAFPALPSSSALVPSTTSTAGTAIAPFSFGSSVKSQSTTAFNAASADSKSATLNVASSMPSGSSSLSAIGSSSGKPPLASVNPFGASSLLLPINGVASVDQQQPPISSTTAGTISPVPTFGVSVAGSNLVSMDSPGSTMDVGSIGSNLSVPSVPTFPSSAALPLSSSSFSFAGLAPPPSNMFSSTQPLAPKDALGSNAPLFGQQSASVGAFGQQPSSVGAFGQQPSSVGPFGQQPSSVGAFGQQSASVGAFGQQSASIGAFGQQPSSGPFGQQPSSVGAFGQKPSQPSSVGPFGQQPSSGPFGQQPSSVGAFGQQPASIGAFGQQPSSGPFGQQPSSVGAFGQQPSQPSSVGPFGQQPSSVGAFGQQPSSGGSSGFAFSPAGSFGSLPFSGSQAGSASSTSFSNPSAGQSAETSGFSLGTVDKQQVRRKVKVKR